MTEVLHQPRSSLYFESHGSRVLDSSHPPRALDSQETPPLPFRFPPTSIAGVNDSTHASSECNLDSAPSRHSETLDVRRHNRKHKSLALPAFTFNPSASTDEEHPEFTTPPQSPPPSSTHSSPSKGARHRRAYSEFIGGDSRPNPLPLRDASPSKDQNTATAAIPEAVAGTTVRKGHRHRRSGALSSQDLSAAARQIATSALEARRAEESARADTASLDFAAGLSLSAASHPAALKVPSPVKVSFADNVEVIPRRSLPTLKSQPHVQTPRPVHSSDGYGPLGHPSPEGKAFDSTDLPDQFPEPVSYGHSMELECTELGEGSVNSQAGPVPRSDPTHQIGDTTEFTDLSDDHTASRNQLQLTSSDELLCQDFDDDPTSAIVSAKQRSASLPILAADKIDFMPLDETVVDLDCANDVLDASGSPPSSQDLRTLRAKSFSAARRSVHSSGLVTTIANNHRRTESAPSLPIPAFERPVLQRLDSVTASEKGFEIENVFEEDEEDATGELASGSDGCRERSNIDAHNSAQPQSKGGGTTRRQVTPTPSLTATHTTPVVVSSDKPVFRHPLSFEATKSLNRANTPNLVLVDSPSPGTKDFKADITTVQPSSAAHGSSTSTPCLDMPGGSYSESQHSSVPRFLGCAGLDTRPSSEGVPSLMSSRSTITSSAHRYTNSTASPSSSDMPDAVKRRPNSAVLPAQRRKRNSIVSLLMTGTSGSRSDSFFENKVQTRMTEDPMDTRQSAKKKNWIRRSFRFWRTRDCNDSGG